MRSPESPIRYTRKPFPSYRHLPGLTPHPRRHPQGHLHGVPEMDVEPLDPGAWRESIDYLCGVDLYNHLYYWEAHEAWEGPWKVMSRQAFPSVFLQGLIQVAAALLKRELGVTEGMRRLSRAGFTRLERVRRTHDSYCGLKLSEFIEATECFLLTPRSSSESRPPLIVLG